MSIPIYCFQPKCRAHPRPLYKGFRFSLESLANFICEYIKDGERTTKRDVLDWWRWFEGRCRVRKPHIGPQKRTIVVVYPPGAHRKRRRK